MGIEEIDPSFKQELEIADLNRAYQQLMKQTIDFAENMIQLMAMVRTLDEMETDARVMTARKFLGSPEVTAFLKERGRR